MLFWILLIAFILLIILYKKSEKFYTKTREAFYDLKTCDMKEYQERKEHFLYKFFEDHDESCFGIIFTIGLILIINILILIFAYAIAPANAVGWVEQQKALEYKYETTYVKDNFNLRNMDLVNEIQDWNIDIGRRKSLEKNLWLGIYYPNILDKYDLHTIELK